MFASPHETEKSYAKDDLLRKVGAYLDEADQLRGLALIARTHSDAKQSQLSALAPFLLPSLLPRAIAIARSIDDEEIASFFCTRALL